jgi:23S rRNA (adenine2503-C2)-methyltransferase
MVTDTLPVARDTRVNLLGLTRAQMEAFFAECGEKSFRAQQVMKWIHHHGVCDFEAMTNLSKSLRAKLSERACVRPPEVVSRHDSADGTRKWLVRSIEGGLVESVLIPDGDRATLCVSSQVGCSLDCSFLLDREAGF